MHDHNEHPSQSHNRYNKFSDKQTSSSSSLHASNKNFLANQKTLVSTSQAPNKRKITAWQAQVMRDSEKWEESRLRTMLGKRTTSTTKNNDHSCNHYSFNPDHDEDHQGSKVHLIIKDAIPNFLQTPRLSHFVDSIPGARITSNTTNISFSTPVNNGMMLPVKDPTSDMAMIARKGSQIVKLLRERREQMRQMRSLERRDNGNDGRIMDKNMNKRVTILGDGHSDDSDNDANINDDSQNTLATSNLQERKSIKEQRQSLPAFACRAQLLRLIGEHQVTVIVGETGSGKTTQLTQYLHEAGYSRKGIIGCTQPRRVAAMSVAKRVAEEVGCVLGDLVGYAIRFEDVTSEQTRIKYMTDGVMLRETLKDSDLDSYAAIIIDEAHERSLQTDVILGLLRQVIRRRRDLRLIITSATMNASKFASFFAGAGISNVEDTVPSFTIPGRTFPVTVQYCKAPCLDYVESAVKQTLAIHDSHLSGDVLIFMTGQEDIEATCYLLQEELDKREKERKNDHSNPNSHSISNQSNNPNLVILPIYAQMPADLQARIFEKQPKGMRKCVVATNIAETSLTVDGIAHVIDSGYYKVKVYNPRIGMDALQVVPISQAGACQRSGRAGRTGPGTAYRMYTEAAFLYELLPSAVPEIQRTNLANVVLLLNSLGIVTRKEHIANINSAISSVDAILDFDFLDAPCQESMISAMYQLWALGALDGQGSLTEIGKAMVEFPLDPSLSRLLLASQRENCVEECLTIVSMLSVPSIFVKNQRHGQQANQQQKSNQDELDAIRERFIIPESDHLTLLNIYNHWSRVPCHSKDHWCTRHFINARSMRRAKEVRLQLADIMRQQLKISFSSCISNTNTSAATGFETNVASLEPVRRCIAIAGVQKAARMRSIGEYVSLRTGLPCHLHPTSALSGLGYNPEYVIYHELLLTSKEFMQCVTAVEPAWLAREAPHFYGLRVM